MHIADLKVPQTWTKLVDLIDLGREKFEIDENKDYYLHNKSNYILYAAESEGVPTEETPEIRIYGGQSAGYIKATGDLYVCSKLPDLYPYPATISVIFSDDVAATNAIAIGNYKPETDVRGAYVYRGSVANRDALPKEGMEIGDVYNLEDTGMNVAWTGKLWDELGGTFSVDLTGYAKKADVDAEFVKVNEALETKATKEEVTEALAAKAEATDVTALEEKVDAKADKTELANYATTEAMNTALDAKQDKGDYPVYQKFVGGLEPDERKTIQLNNFDSISGVTTTGEGVSLAMVSKWDVADFSSSKVHTNLNTKDAITVNDTQVVLTDANLESILLQGDNIKIEKSQMQYPGTELMLNQYTFSVDADAALANKADVETVTALEGKVDANTQAIAAIDVSNYATKEELANKADTAALDAKADKTELADLATKAELEAKADATALDAYATTEAMNAALAAKADVAALANYVTTEANTEALELKADAANVYTKAEVDAKLPVCVDIPIRTLKDQVYEKAEILGWFGVEDEVGLKTLISGDVPLFLKYGISLSTNPHYYKMPIQYIAFESATQVKIVTVALDTSNDVASKYEIVMNLDGTVVEGSSNVKMTITELEGNYATKEELANKADTSALEALQQQLAELTARVEALESPAA